MPGLRVQTINWIEYRNASGAFIKFLGWREGRLKEEDVYSISEKLQKHDNK